MDIELVSGLSGSKRNSWKAFLSRAGLEADDGVAATVLIWDNGQLIATGSRQENILKCIAVDETRQGEGLTATVLTHLRQDAFENGYRHLFLYTKPKNKWLFSSLFFYPIAQTDSVLLMEDRKNGIQDFLNTLPAADPAGTVGAAVMNCDPFTLGHRYLIEEAAADCDRLYIFVLSEDKGPIRAADRMEMVKLGTADIPNVTAVPTGPYLISTATFPTYFLKDRDAATQIQCALDIEIFANYFAPKFRITRRYVGTEPLSQLTKRYNEALKTQLPQKGIALKEFPRLEIDGAPISATAVRAALASHDQACVKKLVPQTTYDYLRKEKYL